MNQYFSSRQLSELCDVGETTIKRWSNMGLIRHHKTVGGHRKFKIEDVLEFLERNNIRIPEHKLEQLNLEKKFSNNIDINTEIILMKGELSSISLKLFENLILYKRDEVEALLSKCIEQGVGVASIFDDVIAPAMYRVGDLWAQRKLGAGEEHIITNILIESVLQIKARYAFKTHNVVISSDQSITKPADQDSSLNAVICTAPESEYHEVGLLGVSMVCQTLGFKVNYVGAAVPFKDLENVIEVLHPSVVCMSITLAKFAPPVFKKYEHFRKVMKNLGVKFVTGGQFFGEKKNQVLQSDFRSSSCRALEEYLRENFQVIDVTDISAKA
ncbi:MAG: B12-binding domain-containing protein [Chloroherpetonaceae bacterium]|nr:B12-binding domain-containing protein [Chloroherpetonaceae bacterium]